MDYEYDLLHDPLITSDFQAYFALDTEVPLSTHSEIDNEFCLLKARLNRVKRGYLDSLQIYAHLHHGARWNLLNGHIIEKFILRAVFTNARPVPDYMVKWRERWLGEVHVCDSLADIIAIKLRYGKREIINDLMAEFDANIFTAENQLQNIQMMIEMLIKIPLNTRSVRPTGAERAEARRQWRILEDYLTEKDDLQGAVSFLMRKLRELYGN